MKLSKHHQSNHSIKNTLINNKYTFVFYLQKNITYQDFCEPPFQLTLVWHRYFSPNTRSQIMSPGQFYRQMKLMLRSGNRRTVFGLTGLYVAHFHVIQFWLRHKKL